MDLRMPKLGFSMTEGTLLAWLVDDGAWVTEGQPLFTVETDKVETDVESPGTGRLVAGETGVLYNVGDVIGQLSEE